MSETPNLPNFENDQESHIFTIEDLTSYLKENRETATALVSAIANEALEDGEHPIERILEQGYEDSFYVDDLMVLNEEFEAIVMTPMIETTTDWDQPFDDYDFGSSIKGLLKDVGVDDELASDFMHCLVRECLNLVEEKGKSKPNSSFVDIFGQKVYEQYKPLMDKRLQELDEMLQEMDEDEELDTQFLREAHSDSLGDAVREAVPEIALWMKEIIEAEGETLVFNALRRMSA